MRTTNKKLITLNRKHEWDQAFWSVPGWNSEKIKAAKVMVVGAGALGNEVLKNLTLLNIGHLVLVDFDVVEKNNLSKSILFRIEDKGSKKVHAAAKHIKSLNNNIKIHTIVGDISTDVGLGLFRRMDVVIGCLDNRLARLYINRLCFHVDKPWVDGGLENLAGSFSVYAPKKVCYECSLSEAARDIITFRAGCPDIAKRNATVGSIATTPIASSIIGAFQVQEALKIIFGNWKSSMLGEGFRYNGMNNFYLQYKESGLKEDCESHIYYDKIIEAEDLSHRNTIREILDWAKLNLKIENPTILLREDVAFEVATSKSGHTCKTAIYKNHLYEAKEVIALPREIDEDIYIKEATWAINYDFPFLDKSLKEIGIPFLEILEIEGGGDVHYVELTGDLNQLIFE